MAITRKQTDAKVTAVLGGVVALDDNGQCARSGVRRWVLPQVAQRLTCAIWQADTVAWMVGDELVILLSDLSANDRTCVEQVTQKCLGTFCSPFRSRETCASLGVSVGIAMNPGATPVHALMSAANMDIYAAKLPCRG
jgi:GGDEF domain-containing protein